jgi:4-aminobutyrate aminotransferase-like enzyme
VLKIRPPLAFQRENADQVVTTLAEIVAALRTESDSRL